MRIAPFYSFFLGMAVEELWHDNDACQIGRSIPINERFRGKGDEASSRKYCPYCQLLNQPWPKNQA
jgi:hypothetical protein